MLMIVAPSQDSSDRAQSPFISAPIISIVSYLASYLFSLASPIIWGNTAPLECQLTVVGDVTELVANTRLV